MDNELLAWHACEHPERRPDHHTRFHPRCSGCAIAYEAQQAPPPPGEFTGWHDHWDPLVLEGIRTGDIQGLRDRLR